MRRLSELLGSRFACTFSLTRACRRDAPPGFSGYAPCRLRRHGHSAAIPHAFAPAALRASLASGGSAQGPSPPRCTWRPLNTAEPAAPDRPGRRPLPHILFLRHGFQLLPHLREKLLGLLCVVASVGQRQ